RLNSSPEVVEAINDLPIKTVNGTTVFIRDVAHVSDKYMPQTNLVHAEGKKGALVSIYKLGNASTLDIVKRVKEAVPKIFPRLPRVDLGDRKSTRLNSSHVEISYAVFCLKKKKKKKKFIITYNYISTY